MLTLVLFLSIFFLEYQYFGYFQNDSHIRKYARTVHIFRKFYFSQIQNVYSNWHIVRYEKNENFSTISIFFIVYYMPIRIHILNVRKIKFTKNVNSTCIFTNMTIILKIIQILVFQKKNRKNCTNVSMLIR